MLFIVWIYFKNKLIYYHSAVYNELTYIQRNEHEKNGTEVKSAENIRGEENYMTRKTWSEWKTKDAEERM